MEQTGCCRQGDSSLVPVLLGGRASLSAWLGDKEATPKSASTRPATLSAADANDSCAALEAVAQGLCEEGYHHTHVHSSITDTWLMQRKRTYRSRVSAWPSCPLTPLPQLYICPCSDRARVWRHPHANWLTLSFCSAAMSWGVGTES